METRDVLLKADKVSVVFERLADGKIPSDDKDLGRRESDFSQVAAIGKQVGLVRVDKPVAYLDIDDTGLGGSGLRPGNELM